MESDLDEEVYVLDNKLRKFWKTSRKRVTAPLRPRPSSQKDDLEAALRFLNHATAGSRHKDARTQRSVMRSLNAVALAANASDSETQLVTLWSAFEALLPEPTKDDGSGARITHFAKLMVPCVVRGYLKSRFRVCYKSCRVAGGKDFQKYVEDVGVGEALEERLAYILSSGVGVQKPLFATVSDTPLMLNRLWRLGKWLSQPEECTKNAMQHELKVTWQVHRIYRERNNIVHSGSRSPFLPTLVENAFLYYRLVIRSLQRAYADHGIYEPHGALQLISGLHEQRNKQLQQLLRERALEPAERQARLLRLIFD